MAPNTWIQSRAEAYKGIRLVSMFAWRSGLSVVKIKTALSQRDWTRFDFPNALNLSLIVGLIYKGKCAARHPSLGL